MHFIKVLSICFVLCFSSFSVYARDIAGASMMKCSKLNKSEYINCIKEVAIAGDIEAQYSLAGRYEVGAEAGVEQDTQQAIYWYQKVAEQECKDFDSCLYIAGAQFWLGQIYNYGKGVEQDYSLAHYWYQQSTERDYTLAQISLGRMYYEGWGVKQDYKQAFYWYQKAAVKGNSEAQSIIAAMYLEGKGVEKDSKKADYWYEKAAIDKQ